MRRISTAALVAFLVAAPGAEAAGVGLPSAFRGGARVDVNGSGQAVVAWDGPTGVRAAAGDRAVGLGPATRLSAATDTFSSPQAAIDDRGDAIVVWETYRATGGGQCSTCPAHLVSNGVWASLRPAGAGFGPPVALAGPRADSGADVQLADPQLAVSSTGHAIVAWSGADGTMAAFRSPGGALGTPQRVLPADFAVLRAAIAGDGETLLTGASGRIAVRPAGGAFGAPELPPGATGTYGLPALPAVNTAGDALVAYYSARGIEVSRRPAGGGWSEPQLLTAVSGAGGRAIALSDGGTGTVTFARINGDPRTGGRQSLLAATVAPGEPVVVEQVNAGLDADASFDAAGVDMDPAGEAAIAFDLRDGLLNRGVVQIALRPPTGPFLAPGTLTPPAAAGHAINDSADVAFGSAGELLVTWVDHYPGEDRVMARWISSAGAGGAVVLDHASARDRLLPAPTGHAALLDTQRRKLDRRGRIVVSLRCLSFDRRPCTGTLKLTAGPRKWSAGRARFAIEPATTKRIAVKLTARARSVLRRRKTITLAGTAVTTAPGATFAGTRARIVVKP